MPRGRSRRRNERRYALRVLFEMDMNDSSLEEVLNGKSKVGEDEPSEFTLKLVRGVQVHADRLDRLISGYAEGWDLDRMPRVDRNILRMSLFEILYVEDIPPGATIDEAVELAKSFSTEDSGKFVNGLLGRINRDREAGKLPLPP
jgi:N utilization substance protein B